VPLVGFSWCAHSARCHDWDGLLGEIMVSMTIARDDIVAWLLEGDPSIRWRVHRDLLGSSVAAHVSPSYPSGILMYYADSSTLLTWQRRGTTGSRML
jgi:hypothetical protein